MAGPDMQDIVLMLAHCRVPFWNDQIASASPQAVHWLRRHQYQGLIVTDDMEMKAIDQGHIGDYACASLEAGVDAVMVCRDSGNIHTVWSALKDNGWIDTHACRSLADKIGRKLLVAISGILSAIGTVILLLSPNMTIIFIGGCIVGAGVGMFFTTNWALGTDIVPKKDAGKFLGISNLAGAGAGAVGSYIGGPLADYFTANFPDMPGLGYMLIFGIFAALFLISSIVLIKVQEQRGFSATR